MRAGGFAELRVIRLLNRRFVSFYFNTGGPGLGKDKAAAEFVLPKVKNKFAHWASFTPQGDYLGETPIYADKDGMFDYLRELLRKHPEFNRMTTEEQIVVEFANKSPTNSLVQKEAGILYEDLGQYTEAKGCYERSLANESLPKTKAEAYQGLLRMARYEKRWEDLAKLADSAEKAGLADQLAGDLAMERGYRLLAEKKYAELRKSMEEVMERQPSHVRMGEFRFYAGVACFFQKELDHAYYHWIWVLDNIPDDHMQRRCAIAAAHRGMPYPNPELGGYKSNHPAGSIQQIQAALQLARAGHDRIVESKKATP